MNEKKDITVAFTGHRSYQGEADAALREVVREMYDRGFRRFLVAMAWGFDLAAGKAVMALKTQYADVELVAVVPYEGFRQLFRDESLALYDEVATAADEVIVVSAIGGNMAFARRNDFLVDNSAVVIAWWIHGVKGGTSYTVKRAVKQGRELRNLCPPRELELF
ncbi:MAG: DUF1273 family protein [Alistipes sp.]|nr:DUF1273 family protein [Alistipes sp.]